jgi:hypothetical protein
MRNMFLGHSPMSSALLLCVFPEAYKQRTRAWGGGQHEFYVYDACAPSHKRPFDGRRGARIIYLSFRRVRLRRLFLITD